MVYRFLRRLTQIALLIYFRKVYINGIEKIPKNRPIFIAANHPNGFVEPLLLACFLSEPLHFLVRGDMFEKKWLKPLLIATNQIPIYRGRDGFSSLRQNKNTFSEVYKVLQDNGSIVIFVEGTTEMVKHLRPLQMGMARMALRANEQMPEVEPVIVPVALNFCHPDRFRSEVMMDVGDPILCVDYAEPYQKDRKSAVRELTKTTFAALKSVVVEIPDNDLVGYNNWILRPEGSLPIQPIPLPSYNTDRSEKENLRYSYYDKVKTRPKESGNTSTFSLSRVILYPLLWIFYAFHALPLFFTNLMVKKLMTRVIFQSALRIAFGLAVFFLYYLIIFLFILVIDIHCWWIILVFWISGMITLILDNLIYNTKAKLKL